jgi:hypothetical protein
MADYTCSVDVTSYIYSLIYFCGVMNSCGEIITSMIQAGKSRVHFPMRLLDFSIDLNLPATLWSWG